MWNSKAGTLIDSKFFHRDDAILIWEAILRWVESYVDLYYETDIAVQGDRQLKRWFLDVERNGSLLNFKRSKTKHELLRVLSLVIFLSSAQHAAVNFPQKSDMTFAPAIAGAVWNPLPKKTPATEAQWIELMPFKSVALEQISILFLLGSVYYNRLGLYKSASFPFFGTLERKAEEALKKFNDELEAIETLINQRNTQRGFYDYEFLLPSKIPASINI